MTIFLSTLAHMLQPENECNYYFSHSDSFIPFSSCFELRLYEFLFARSWKMSFSFSFFHYRLCNTIYSVCLAYHFRIEFKYNLCFMC